MPTRGNGRSRSVYYAALRACPGVYHRAYRLLGRWRWPLHRLTGSLVPWLDREVGAWDAEWVVATHVFCAGAAERVARRRPLGTAGLITDLVDDAYWNRTRLDRYLVGTPELAARLALAGIPSPSVRVSGLPVDPVFFAPLDRSEARRRLGLDPTAFTVLLLGGGAGFGPLRAAAAALGRGELPLQVVAVAGRNEELHSRLETLRLTARVPLHVVGFTGRIHEYVAAADVVVTKPGGMTVAECLSRRRPMVLLGAPLPGPEAENHRWLVGRGLASPARDASELVELLRVRLPDRGDELRRMR